MIRTITPQDLRSLMAGPSPHAVLDVREPMEFHEAQIFRSTSLPRGALEFRIAKLVPVRSLPAAVLDEGGPRAGRAAKTLEGLGYPDVRPLEGGLAGWRAAGLPTVSGTNVPSKDFGEQVHVQEAVPEIGAGELFGLINGPAPPRILDARTEAEYERFSVPTARSLPGGELILHAWDLMQDRSTPLIINCAGRTRSIIGAQTLRRLGVPAVRALRNGGMGIMLAGLPLDRGKPAAVPAPSARSRAHAEELAARLAAEEGVPFVTAGELEALLASAERETVYLFDVRLAPEFRAGHIPGAVSIPGGQAVQRTDEAVAVRAGRVVTCCDANARGVMTAYWLRRMGLRACVLRGGLGAWREAGLPLAQGEGGASGEGPAEAAEPLGLAEARRIAPGLAPEEAREMAPGAVILDVDPSPAFREGHLAGARWASRAWLEDRAGEWVPSKESPVLVACGDGMRSVLAARTLAGMGYARAAYLTGGKRAWARAGLPLEAGEKGIFETPQDVALKPYDIGRQAMESYLSWEEALGSKYRERG
ncbi:MAG: sulfurtransferase [Candidatus Tectomicrobia bacterium]|nr:sulfurtransferase [Candidatus Tectomicrobia bacterium]